MLEKPTLGFREALRFSELGVQGFWKGIGLLKV